MAKRESFFESPASMATQFEALAAQHIAYKYCTMLDELKIESDVRTRSLAAQILFWHTRVEALRLDLLATYGEPDSLVRMQDLAHDIGGVARFDDTQSARFALAYHPPARLPLVKPKGLPQFEVIEATLESGKA